MMMMQMPCQWQPKNEIIQTSSFKQSMPILITDYRRYHITTHRKASPMCRELHYKLHRNISSRRWTEPTAPTTRNSCVSIRSQHISALKLTLYICRLIWIVLRLDFGLIIQTLAVSVSRNRLSGCWIA